MRSSEVPSLAARPRCLLAVSDGCSARPHVRTSCSSGPRASRALMIMSARDARGRKTGRNAVHRLQFEPRQLLLVGVGAAVVDHGLGPLVQAHVFLLDHLASDISRSLAPGALAAFAALASLVAFSSIPSACSRIRSSLPPWRSARDNLVSPNGFAADTLADTDATGLNKLPLQALHVLVDQAPVFRGT